MSDFLDQRAEAAVVRVQAGDRDSYRPVVEALLPSVRAFVAGRSLPGIDVDEVVQRTFVEAYQGIAGFQPGTSLRAWVLAIARYQLLMETTRLKRLADYHSRYVPVTLAREVERRLAREEGEDHRLAHLRDCLATLPGSAREVLRLRYELGRSMDEIAVAMQRTAGAIRKQLCLLRQQLHDCVTRKLAWEHPDD